MAYIMKANKHINPSLPWPARLNFLFPVGFLIKFIRFFCYVKKRVSTKYNIIYSIKALLMLFKKRLLNKYKKKNLETASRGKRYKHKNKNFKP